MNLDLQATIVFNKNYQSNKKIKVNQGGSRSSKTYSLAQLMIVKALEKPRIISIVRKTLPALKATAYRDFLEILEVNGIYNPTHHNKTELTYTLQGSLIEFVSVDQPQKIRGRKRNILWGNEANELGYDDWRQLIMRTEEDIYLDFNPSDEYHWIYDHVLTREDSELIKSTYKDNPFLAPEIIKEIERMEKEDPEYWKVYGLGERATKSNKIYTNWEIYHDEPKGEKVYGLDFGYNHPTSLVQVIEHDGAFYIKELIYESYLTNSMRLQKANDIGLDKNTPLYPDIEDTAAVEEWRRAGFNVKDTNKGAGSVKAGIDFIKRHKLYIHADSVNLQKEIKGYSWKTKGEQVLDEPVKINDDGVDSFRYPIYSHFAKPKKSFGFL
jgi:phage terminase large subunit